MMRSPLSALRSAAEIVFTGPERAFVSEGLTEGELMVVTDIAAPVAGMPLRVAEVEGDGAEQGTQMVADEGEGQ